MKLKEQIDKKLEGIYEVFREDEEDLTGWGLLQETKNEASNEKELYDYMVSRIAKISLSKNEIINAPKIIESLIKSPFYDDEILIEIGEDVSDFKELYKGIYLNSGTLLKILGFLRLDKTKDSFIQYLLLKNEEINPEIYLGNKIVEDYKNNPSEILSKILHIFEEEYEEKKLSEKPRIIKIKNENRIVRI